MNIITQEESERIKKNTELRNRRKSGFYRVKEAGDWIIAYFKRDDRPRGKITQNGTKDWHAWYTPQGHITHFTDPWLEIDETPIDCNETTTYNAKLHDFLNRQFEASHKKIKPLITSSELDDVDALVSKGLISELWSADENSLLYVCSLSQLVSLIRSVRD